MKKHTNAVVLLSLGQLVVHLLREATSSCCLSSNTAVAIAVKVGSTFVDELSPATWAARHFAAGPTAMRLGT